MPNNTDDSTIVEFEYESQKIQIEGYHKDDLIFNKIKRSKSFYELKLLEKARQYNLSGVYIDIGANIGNHAIFFNKFCPASKVYCFEIEKSIFKIYFGTLVCQPHFYSGFRFIPMESISKEKKNHVNMSKQERVALFSAKYV